MSDQQDNTTQAPIYKITIEGHLGEHWIAVFDGLDITLTDDGDTTVLYGPIVDQAALHGLLRRIRDSGMTLISVQRVPPDDVNPSNDSPQNE